MRNKSITALPLLVGIEALPFATAANLESDSHGGCSYGICPNPPTSPTPAPNPPQGPEIKLFMTLEPPDNSTENFGDGTINLGVVNGDGFDDVAIDSGRATHIHFGGPGLSQTPDLTIADEKIRELAGNFDFNQDGFSDLAGNLNRDPAPFDLVHVYFGGARRCPRQDLSPWQFRRRPIPTFRRQRLHR